MTSWWLPTLTRFLDRTIDAWRAFIRWSLPADVFVYCGDLAPIAAAVAGCWSRAGCSPSRSKPMTARACILGEKLRYAHGEAHVSDAIGARRIDRSAILAQASKRNENNRPVPSLVVVAER